MAWRRRCGGVRQTVATAAPPRTLAWQPRCLLPLMRSLAGTSACVCPLQLDPQDLGYDTHDIHDATPSVIEHRLREVRRCRALLHEEHLPLVLCTFRLVSCTAQSQ